MQNRNLRNIRVPKKQRGLTLIELAVGLAIVLAISALVVGVYTTTSRSQRTNDVQTQLTQIASQVRSMAPQGSYTGIDDTVLARSKKVPEAWVVDNAGTPEIRHPFGGSFDIAPASVNGGTDNGFAITVDELPVAACNDIVTNSQANFAEIDVGSTPLKTYGAAAVDAGTISTACTPATGDTVSVTFTAV